MSDDRLYLSYGGGVNSLALMLELIERGEEFEAVFADHGADYPETYEHIDSLVAAGYPIKVIKARRDGLDLYDYCMKYRMIPSMRFRWCTEWHKVRPLIAYYKERGTPAFDLMGIDAGEPQRAKYRERVGLIADYPLVRWGINRAGCRKIIERHGLSVPKKSGCFFCPFQNRVQFKECRDEHPGLWCKTLQLEHAVVDKRTEEGKQPFYLKTKPIEEFVNDEQGDLFNGFSAPCQCFI